MIDILSGVMLASAYDLESGLMHSKQSGRYEVVQVLPKKSSSFDQMFDYADATANLRALYEFNDFNEHHTGALALGGIFGFDTASYEGVSLHVKATTSQHVHALSRNSDESSFTYLSQAYISYNGAEAEFMAGRLLIDSPYADSDDIRMAPNTFEALHVNYALSDAMTLQSFYASRWAGFDSGEDQSRFKTLVDGGFGLLGVSLDYKVDAENSAALWLYYADAMSTIAYAEYSGHYNIADDFHIEYGFQASHINELEHSGVEGSVVGVMSIIDYGPIFGGFAFNRGFISGNNVITDGFGGGPYYTSLDEATIGAVSENALGEDVMAYRLGLGYDFESSNLVLEAVFGKLRSRYHTVDITESDLIVTYAMNERWSLDGVLMFYASQKNDDDFERGILRINYNF